MRLQSACCTGTRTRTQPEDHVYTGKVAVLNFDPDTGEVEPEAGNPLGSLVSQPHQVSKPKPVRDSIPKIKLDSCPEANASIYISMWHRYAFAHTYMFMYTQIRHLHKKTSSTNLLKVSISSFKTVIYRSVKY